MSKNAKSGAEVFELLNKLPEARVQIIQAHLMTPQQAQWLEQVDLTVDQILCGYYSQDVAETVKEIFAAWDEFLGKPYFADLAVEPELAEAVKTICEAEVAKEADASLSPKEKAAKQHLTTVVQTHKGEDGKEYPVTPLNIQSHGWRRFAVECVRLLDPVAYEKYRQMKYSAGPNPDLETRREAYRFIIDRFLELSYTIPGL